jgi:hypothetical protein
VTLTPSPDAPTTPDGDLAEVAPRADAGQAPVGDANGLAEFAPSAPADQPVAPEPAASVAEPAAAGGDNGAQAGPPPNRADGTARAPRRGGRPAPRPAVQADRGFPRAERPGNVPSPQHHHLPGWVRRDFAKARPALADLLGLLQGEERQSFQQRIDELTAGITSGKFSLAWQYPAIIDEGRKLYESQRTQIAEAQRVQRQLESARRKAGDRIRDASDLLAADAAARLSRSLRQANDLGAIAEIEAEADRALSTARSAGSRRRDKEIERTRNRLLRTLPKAALIEEPQTETWQDVLRRFAQDQEREQEKAPQEAAAAGSGD